MSNCEKNLCDGQECGSAGNGCHGELENGATEKQQICGGCAGGNCPGGVRACGGCTGSGCPGQDQGADCNGGPEQSQGSGCPGAMANGCGGCCPHAAGKEFEWDYDDTVLVFSSDMLEESP